MASKPVTEAVFRREMKELRSEFQRDLKATTKALVETIVRSNEGLHEEISRLGDRFESALFTSVGANRSLEGRVESLEKRVRDLESPKE